MRRRFRDISPRWIWLCMLVPAFVLFGTYSDSWAAPLGWVGALFILVFLLALVIRTDRRKTKRETL